MKTMRAATVVTARGSETNSLSIAGFTSDKLFVVPEGTLLLAHLKVIDEHLAFVSRLDCEGAVGVDLRRSGDAVRISVVHGLLD